MQGVSDNIARRLLKFSVLFSLWGMSFQFAQDEDSCIGDFAVVEYETAEQAEQVQEVTDGMTIKGKRVQVSYCAPGAPGRSTLAALIAAQRMVREVQICLQREFDTPGAAGAVSEGFSRLVETSLWKH